MREHRGDNVGVMHLFSEDAISPYERHKAGKNLGRV
jgi:hypothetical protein